MENRVIKFRCWNKKKLHFIHSDWKYGESSFWDTVLNDYESPHEYLPLQQFTGLMDFKGIQIYEGDIIEFQLEDGTTERGTVRFAAGGYWTTQAEGHSEELLSEELEEESFEATIIGHIYGK